MQTTIKIFSSKKNNWMKAPCLRTVPELYIGEKYWVSFNGVNAVPVTLLDVWGDEKMVLVQIGEKQEPFYWTEIGANPSWAKRNRVIDPENYN